MRPVERLVRARRLPGVGALAYYLLLLLGADIPRRVRIGRDFTLPHFGSGVVIHEETTIGDRVTVYSGVTVGRADAYRPMPDSGFEGVVIEDDVMLCSGAKVLCKKGVLTVRRGTVVGANAVLLESTGEDEVWVGAPARCVGKRPVG